MLSLEIYNKKRARIHESNYEQRSVFLFGGFCFVYVHHVKHAHWKFGDLMHCRACIVFTLNKVISSEWPHFKGFSLAKQESKRMNSEIGTKTIKKSTATKKFSPLLPFLLRARIHKILCSPQKEKLKTPWILIPTSVSITYFTRIFYGASSMWNRVI